MSKARLASAGMGLILVAVLGIYGWMILETRKHSPLHLLSCIDSEPAIVAWTCKRVLVHDSLRPNQVKQLNQEAGALYPVLSKDLAVAEEMLRLFLSRGVDINAGDASMRNWTALYSTVGSSDLERTKILLRHGAKADVRDIEGITPLDSARRLQQMYPNETNRLEIIRVLEESPKR
jgi:hypothetical protein